jgi:hypothetical protein
MDDCQWYGIEGEVYVRRLLDLLVLIFDTCNVYGIANATSNCGNVV